MSKSELKTITQKEVAERAGVSSAVVSYVINNGPRQVSDEARSRVLSAIAELGYRPNKFAQALGKNEGNLAQRHIGIVIGGSSSVLQRPFYAALLAGIYEQVNDKGYRIRFMDFWNDLHDPVLFNEHIHPEEISSIILLAADLLRVDPNHIGLIGRIQERIGKIVCLDTQINNFTTITFDRHAAARMVTEHFIRLGHKRIAFVGNVGRRVSGYRQTLMDHHISIQPEYIQHPGVFNSPEEGYQGALQLLQLEVRPSAIFAASDDVAIGVMSAVQMAGLRIPHDIAIASIDDNPYAAFLHPSLTTVRVPTRQMGAYALHAISLPDIATSASGTSIVIDTEIIVRESCGARS